MRSDFTPEQRDAVEAFRAEHDVPGVAAALVAGAEVVAAGGFGLADVARGAPVTARTRFPIASLTKSFTALAAIREMEAGRLSLDDEAARHVPGLLVHSPRVTRALTLRRLLSHGGGLGRTGHQDRLRESAVNPYPDREALVAALAGARLQSEPGATYSYSNEGYALAGHAVERAAGRPLEALIADDLLGPAGMDDSAVTFRAWREAGDRACLYAGPAAGPFDSGERHGERVVVRLPADYRTFLATGGIVSTAADLARYQIETLRGAGSRLAVSAGGLDQMRSVQRPYGDTGWGYGLGYQVMWAGSTKVIGHSGGLPGVSTYSLMVPSERVGVVVLANRGDVKAFELAEALMGLLRGGPPWRGSPGAPLPFATRWPEPSAADLAGHAGTYRFRKGPARVEAAPGGVVVRTPSRYDGPEQVIETRQVGPDVFLGLRHGACIHFVRDAGGRVRRFLHTGYAYERASDRSA